MSRRIILWGLSLLAFAAGCASAPPPAKQPDAPPPPWNMQGGGPARTSRTTYPVPAKWSESRLGSVSGGFSNGDEEYATPIAVGPVVYTGFSGKVFEARRWSDGTRLWAFPMKGRVVGSAAYAGGLFFVADDEGYLVAVGNDGKEAWRFRTSYPIVTSPVAAAGKVYVACSDQNIFCLEAPTGRPIWQYGRKFPRRNAQWKTPYLAWAEDRCYAAFSDGAVVALDADVGRVIWRAEVGKEGLFGEIVAGPSVEGGRVFAGALKGPVVSLDSATGKEIWRRELQVSSGFAVGDGSLYVGTPTGRIVALSSIDGAKQWDTAVGKGIPGPPVLAGGTVLAGVSDGDLVALDAKTGAVKNRWSPGGGVNGQPLVFEGGILFLSNDGVLRRIEESR